MRRSMPAPLTACAVGLAALLSACGGEADDTTETAIVTSGSDQAATSVPPLGGTASSSATDVCALLTNEQVEGATGFPVRDTHTGFWQGFATGECGWELNSDMSSVGLADFTISVKTPGGKAHFDVLADQGLPPVPVGDDAFQQGESIWAIKGDSLVVVGFGFLGEVDEPVQAMLPLIEIVLSQL